MGIWMEKCLSIKETLVFRFILHSVTVTYPYLTDEFID